MSGWRGILAAMLGLIALQTVVGTNEGPGRTAGLIDVITRGIASFVDPSKPAFADHSSNKGGSSGGGSSGGPKKDIPLPGPIIPIPNPFNPSRPILADEPYPSATTPPPPARQGELM